MIGAIRKRLLSALKDDRGAAALVIAAVIAVIAFTALSIFLNKFIGSRELARVQSASSSQGRLVQAVFTAFLKGGSPYTLPCPDPDSSPTGVSGGASGASTTCDGTAVVTGVLPWKALGLSQDDVVDAYGNYFTYVVSGDAKTMCYSVNNDVTGSSEITGSLKTASDLSLVTPNLTRSVAFAVIGH